MSWWDDKDFLYKQMTKKHKELVNFVKQFVKEKDIRSILEVGGGKNQMSDLVNDYLNIDINTSLSDSLYGDFTEMDLTSFINKFDLLLSLAVIEHCEGYERFLEQVKEVNPKYAIISFFNRLNRQEDFFVKKNKYGGEFWNNKYSKEKIVRFLEGLGLYNYNFAEIGRDNVLIICLCR